MKIHAISTGRVKITQSWLVGREDSPFRLLHTLADRNFTEWLPIYCFVIEHPDGLMVVDTGIPASANDPVYFPPFMPLMQRAAPFDITPEEELGPQMRALGLDPADVRWVIQTHLHQDHEGGFHYFPQAEVIVSRKEWDTANGLKGRLAGYLNYRWPKDLDPTLIDFEDGPFYSFDQSHTVTAAGDVLLVPTPGHSGGHLSVIIRENNQVIFLAGDAAYSQELLLANKIDGVGPSVEDQHDTKRRIIELSHVVPTVFVPSHEWAGAERLEARRPIPTVSESHLSYA
ncbi:MAG: N-acyl homoserine lactonase family protein [Chloroflexota bacterium]